MHTGTNDLENNSKIIFNTYDSLIKISETTLNRFPTPKIFFSKLHQDGDFHLKGVEVNSMVKRAIQSNNFQLVCHSNLTKGPLFFDKKHLNKFSGVQIKANNFGNCFAKSFPNWLIKTP